MALYYFHICNGTGFVEDEEGRECADDEQARDFAVLSARDVMASDLRSGQLDLTSFIEVENAAKELVLTLPFADAVEIRRDHVGEAASLEVTRPRPNQAN